MEKKNASSEYWTNLLIDFLTGKITVEEQALLFEWIRQSEENRFCYTQLKELWFLSGIGNLNSPFHKENAFHLFKGRVEAALRNKRLKRKRIFIWAAGIAALLLPFVLFLYVGNRYMELKNSLADRQTVFTSVSAPKGSQSQIELPDGTHVRLNAGSSLRYANTFGREDRNLTLAGEAYFDVTKNKTLPFVVRLGDLKIQVLGTRFNVRAYEQLKQIQVALMEGSVSLQNMAENQNYLLVPMEIAVYSKQQDKMEIVKGLSSQANGWTSGDIVFNGETFEEIAFILEQLFDVNIQIEKESLKKRHFRGDFTKNESIERIFNVMATDGQFAYEITGDHIIIH